MPLIIVTDDFVYKCMACGNLLETKIRAIEFAALVRRCPALYRRTNTGVEFACNAPNCSLGWGHNPIPR